MHHKEIEMQDHMDRIKDRVRDRMFMDALAEADEEMETAEDTWVEGVKAALDEAEKIKARHAEGQRIREWLDDMGWHEPLNATDYMEQAAEQMEDRAASRDQEDGERSMARAVVAFNAIYGHALSETEGWQFMSLLKKSRGAGGCYREDDYVDDIAYAALAAESAGKEQD